MVVIKCNFHQEEIMHIVEEVNNNMLNHMTYSN